MAIIDKKILKSTRVPRLSQGLQRIDRQICLRNAFKRVPWELKSKERTVHKHQSHLSGLNSEQIQHLIFQGVLVFGPDLL